MHDVPEEERWDEVTVQRGKLQPLARRAKDLATRQPRLFVHPDGRLQFNTYAMQLLELTGPPTAPKSRPEAIRLYLCGAEPGKRGLLLIERAEKDDPNAIRLFPVGRRGERWPQVHVARGASILRQDLQIAVRARYTLKKGTVQDDGRRVLVADLDNPEPVSPGMPTDELYNLLEAWVQSGEAPFDKPLTRRKFYQHLMEFAKRHRFKISLLQKQLSDYLFLHADLLREKLGLEVQTRAGGSPKYVLRRKK